MKKTVFILILFSMIAPGSLTAQTGRTYLKAVTFYVAVDDWADVWINGIPIIDSQPYTSSGRGPQAIAALPKSLCYFQRENILAIEVSDKAVSVKSEDDSVGIAYILQMVFSDGRQMLLTSDNAADHHSRYIPERMAGEPREWHQMTFNDEAWAQAFSTGPSIPFAAFLTNFQTHQPVSFLSARSNSPAALAPGERHLFRRKFFMDIVNNPDCEKAAPSARMEPLVVTQPDMRHPVNIPTATPIPPPTSTFTPVVFLEPEPTATRIPAAPPPRTRPRTRVWVPLTPTPTFRAAPRPVLEAARLEEPLPQAPRTAWTPTLVALLAQPLAEAQTIVFESPPANIYMSFADGPGIYRLEVFDGSGRRLKIVFEKRIVAAVDGWAVWDGKNGNGEDVPAGRYYVLFSKDGHFLKKIFVTRSPLNR